jgi:hypothetical protein
MGGGVRPCSMQMRTDVLTEIYTNRGPLKEDSRNGHYRLCDDVLFRVDRSSHSACQVGAAAGLVPTAEQRYSARCLGVSSSAKLTLTRPDGTCCSTQHGRAGRVFGSFRSFRRRRSERTFTLRLNEARRCQASADACATFWHTNIRLRMSKAGSDIQ